MTKQLKTNGRSSSARRDEILSVAAELFASRGFEATSIREIADGAGILPGSLYHHFTSKEEMLHDLLQHFVEQLVPRYEQVIADSREAKDTLAQLIATGLAISLENSQQLSILMQERNFLSRNPEFTYVNQVMQDIDRIWYGVLQEGVRNKTFSAQLDMNLVLRTIMDILASTAVWYTPGSRYTPEQIVDNQIHLLLNGLLVNEANSSPTKKA